MKLVTFKQDDQVYIGAVIEESVINLNIMLAEPLLTMVDLIGRGLSNIEMIEKQIETINMDGDNKQLVPLEEITLQAPLQKPGKIVCVGLNYNDPLREQQLKPPKRPLIFSKWPSCIIGPDDHIILPSESEQVDYEAELGVVISKPGKNIEKVNAYDHIFGYVIVNDVSARDVQFADGQWIRGKSFDTFAPSGPYLVTANELKDPQSLSIRCLINDVVLQDSNTSKMIFEIDEVLAYLSKGFTFEAGDLLLTGSPAGVGFFRDPHIFLEDGDEVRIEIEGLGVLTNTCVREK